MTGFWWWDDAVAVATMTAQLQGRRMRVFYARGKWRVAPAVHPLLEVCS